MTITCRTHPDDGYFELEVNGGISHEEGEALLRDVTAFVERHKPANMLEIVHRIGMMDPSLMLKGMKFDLTHLKDFGKVALVTDMGWLGPLTRIAGAIWSAEIRIFPMDRLEEARAWLKGAQV